MKAGEATALLATEYPVTLTYRQWMYVAGGMRSLVSMGMLDADVDPIVQETLQAIEDQLPPQRNAEAA